MEDASGEALALDPRVRWRWMLRGVGGLMALAAVGTAAAWLAPIGVPPQVAAVVVFGGGLGLWGVATQLRYRRWRYRLESDGLTLTHGVVTHVRTVVPYTRIQHVDTQRGPLDRLFGLGAVVVYTAGTRGADVSIPGLESEQADRMRERLREASARTAGEDAV
jgi:membrane protein YdbS with pleckstrin-like domain